MEGVDATAKPAKKAPAKKKAVKPGAKPRRRKTDEVDKGAAEDVQPLLATLKDVRDEVEKIVAELKSE
jgi:hypothetical protein